MKNLFLIILSMVVAFGLFVSGANASLIISIDPDISFNIEFNDVDYTGSTFDMAVGDTVSVSLYATSNVGLFGAGADIGFDADQLSADNLSSGTGWVPISPLDTTLPGHIKYELGAFTPFVSSNEKILLVTFDLTCLEFGLSNLEMNDLNTEPNWLAADEETVLDDEISWPVQLASVNNVPIPGAFLLLGSGLLCLLGISRKVKE